VFDHPAQHAQDLTARTFYRVLDKLDTYEDRSLSFFPRLLRIVLVAQQ
jgi:hypothetical protein